jgi:hypothetical protein
VLHAGASGQPQLHRARHHLQLDVDDLVRDARLGEVELGGAERGADHQVRGDVPDALAGDRAEHAADLVAGARVGDDGRGPVDGRPRRGRHLCRPLRVRQAGQVEQHGVQVAAGTRREGAVDAAGELVEVEQAGAGGSLQQPDDVLALGVGDTQEAGGGLVGHGPTVSPAAGMIGCRTALVIDR